MIRKSEKVIEAEIKEMGKRKHKFFNYFHLIIYLLLELMKKEHI